MKKIKFNNIFESRRSINFTLVPKQINRKRNIKDNEQKENTLKSFYQSYKNFIEELQKNFYHKEEIIANKSNIGLHNPFAKAFKDAGIEVKTDSANNNKFSYEWYNTVQFLYKGLEELFTGDFIEHKNEIKYNKNGKKKQQNYITFGDLGDNNFLKNFFETFFEEAEKNLYELKQYNNEGLENKSRRADILFLVKKIQSREHLGKVLLLFEKNYIQHKNNTSIIEQLKIIGSNLKEIIQNLIVELQSSQAFGTPIEHISLNYYSVNKTPKELDEDIQNKLNNNHLNEKYIWSFENNIEEDSKHLKTFFNLKNDEEKALKLISKDLQEKIDIKELKEKINFFKAQQKAALLQLLQTGKYFSDIWDNNNKSFKPFVFEFMGEKYENFVITLFSDIGEDKYNEMLDLTNQIERENDKEERKKLKMKRGKYFQFQLKLFKNFSEAYKKIAQKYGRESTEIKSLERQRIDATRLRGWGFVSKIADNFFINTFDIENTKGIFKEIKNLQDDGIQDDGNGIQIFTFSSITLRALDKLCFKEKSNFIKHIDTKDYNESFESDNGKVFSRLKSKKTLLEEGELLNFYIHILEKQTSLHIKYRSEESLDILKKSKNIEEFEINLKLETYTLKEINISQETYIKILTKYKGNSYKITSYDIERGNKTKKYTEWWFDFWDKKNKEKKYITRINPELTIFFKGKEEDFIISHQNIKNNRRLHDRFILSTNFSFHANKAYIDSAFIDEDNRRNSIDNFNKIFNKNNSLDYFYGLDKGTNELVTLGIFKQNGDNIQSVNISKKIPVYKITDKGLQYFEYLKYKDGHYILDKNGDKKKRYLSKNVSYFIKDLDNKELFKKVEIYSCLGDLTSAKLIKGNIILNADIFTTLNLYKTTAKRFLYDAITKGSFEGNTVFYDEKEKYFYYKFENRKETYQQTIFYFKEEFSSLPFDHENYKSIEEEIEITLNQYIEHIKGFLEYPKEYNNNEDISMKKINNYKNAISANIVGIIVELQKHFNGYVCYETLDEGQILNKGLNTFIGNVVNEKIYNRLQLNLEVPPILKKFRTDIGSKNIIQHGKVIYIHEKNTSSACPLCNEKLLKQSDNGDLEDKNDKEIFKLGGHLSDFEHQMKHLTNEEYNEWLKNESFKKANTNRKGEIEENKYHAGKLEDLKTCNYFIGNTSYPEFKYIESGDDLATYNIAKKAKEYLEKD